MSEPTHEMMRRAVSALGPFASAYRLSLNPEDLAEIAYAVLKYANSDDDMSEIQEAVAEQATAVHLLARTVASGGIRSRCA
jgi:hypothetical protein